MIIIAAVDDRFGMMFNGRRQSQDKKLREWILERCQESTLWMNAYSRKQFDEETKNVSLQVDEEFLEKAGNMEYCFVENMNVLPYIDKIEKIYLCKWNRAYPGDFSFSIKLSDDTWQLEDVIEFPGFSHEKITIEVFAHV